MLNISANPNFLYSFDWSFCDNRFKTEMAIGSIMTVVAVLDIHMLKKAVARLKPSIIPVGLVPVILIRLSAIRRCSFRFSMANAIMKPPINKKIIGLAYGAKVSFVENKPKEGNNTIGSSAGNVNWNHFCYPPQHQSKRQYRAFCKALDYWSLLPKTIIKSQAMGPTAKAIFLNEIHNAKVRSVLDIFK